MTGKGGLPPNRMLDLHLCNRKYRDTLSKSQIFEVEDASPFWSSTLYAYAGKNRVFQPGTDIYDVNNNLRLKWSEIERFSLKTEALARPQTGLAMEYRSHGSSEDSGNVMPSKDIFIRSILPAQHGDERIPGMEISGWESFTGRRQPDTGMVEKISWGKEWVTLEECRDMWVSENESPVLGPVVRGLLRETSFVCFGVFEPLGVTYVVWDILDDSGRVMTKGLENADMQALREGRVPDSCHGMRPAVLAALLRDAKTFQADGLFDLFRFNLMDIHL